jgi:hypothetical protein
LKLRCFCGTVYSNSLFQYDPSEMEWIELGRCINSMELILLFARLRTSMSKKLTSCCSDLSLETVPTARAECGFAAVGNQLFVFAGRYIPPGQLSPGQTTNFIVQHRAVFVRDSCCSVHGESIHNSFFLAVSLMDLHLFDLKRFRWIELSQTILGTGPSVRYAFGFAVVDKSLHVFGGASDSISGNELLNSMLLINVIPLIS